MKIIPVIDIKDGLVVHAKQGQRHHYQPINTPLCPTAGIFPLIEKFVHDFHFATLYLADLNAIMAQGDHEGLIQKILTAFPGIQFWIDRGHQPAAKHLNQPGNYSPVLGSESYRKDNLGELQTLNKNFLLSLDFSGQKMLGPNQLFANPALWPDRLIIMTLDRVGSGKGPDLAKLTAFKQAHPKKRFLAAGGIRNLHDLKALEAIGVEGALIASALHAGAITADNIRKLGWSGY